jgi:hypothetical protein
MALPALATALFAQGHTAPATRAVDEAMACAWRSGNGLYLQASVVTAASSFLWANPPDFHSCAALLARFADSADADADYKECWRQALWGFSLLGTAQPKALPHLARAATLADRMDLPPQLHFALRLIGIAAVAWRPQVTAQLSGYLQARPCAYPLPGPYEAWVGQQFEAALTRIPAHDLEWHRRIGSQLTRRQMLSLIADVVAAPSDPEAASLPTESVP